jgi:flagellar L-ring protein precursor FlgH
VPEIEPSLSMPADRSGRVSTAATVAQQQQGGSASLFRTGAGALFRDQRANKVGDILTIKINIADKADLGNNTSRTRGGSETGGLGGLLGISPVKKLLGADASAALETNSGSKYAGGGTTARSETINMTMAAIVTQVMPNGNLMIRGRQEVRVNFEMRELIVTGIIRPEDIARDNSIQPFADRRGARDLWRQGPAHRCAAGALGSADLRRALPLLSPSPDEKRIASQPVLRGDFLLGKRGVVWPLSAWNRWAGPPPIPY